ncbi:hypothetical protein PZB74_10520 [Porifericola rhodea]|uniref:hypothetical protein n=1 Tax=Porifericola rhodea TaxID=930972 RepID=UPI0026650C8D|nr:hypothetical protein [Porifericola rhodea]WKN33759.1 hypothetical protein PZB74_10520 [Porifericola rhodea]
MKKQKYTYYTEAYFPIYVKFLGFMMVFASLVLLSQSRYMPAIILILLAIAIFSGRYGLKLDLKQKTYREFVEIMGIKNGKTLAFSSLQELQIRSSKVAQRMYSLSNQSSTVRHIEYDAYLILDEDVKIHLLSKKKKASLIKSIEKIRHDLAIPLHDLSQPQL